MEVEMKRPGSRRPSPALVVACLALFVALGGTVMAATKIDGKTIRVKSLPGDRLELGSLPGNRLKPGTVSGSRIDLGSLGEVPTAAHAAAADTARRAQSAASADLASEAAKVDGREIGCPQQTREFAGGCWDLTTSPTALTAPEAAAACAARGGELPKPLALLAFRELPGIQIALDGEWSNEIWMNGETQYSVIVLTGDGLTHLRSPKEQLRYRCVLSPID
jgi:hypothetical protein